MNVTFQNNKTLSGGITQKEKAVAFVVVRLSSSRLPGKQFRNIGDRSMLQWIIDNLAACKEIDEIVIATVAEKENEPLCEFARDQGLPCFRYEGEVDHVTTRLRRAAEFYGADICVLVSGDCPLLHALSIDYLIRELRKHPEADVIRVEANEEGSRPALEGIGVARKRAWQLADDLSDRPELKEHQFPIIGKRPDLFKTHLCKFSKELYNPYHQRFSVDTWADLEFMNAIHHALTAADRSFSLPDVLEFLKTNPAVMDINRHVHQMGVGEERRKILMVVDAGKGFGYGHLMRSRELALQITERLGWPVTFAVDDEKARDLLNDSGIRTINNIQRSVLNTECIVDGGHFYAFPTLECLRSFDLILLDIYHQRDLGTGWRQAFPPNAGVVVLDHSGKWTKEADLVIIPGVTFDKSIVSRRKEHPKVIAGNQYIILRREIRRGLNTHIKKDLDLLAYLYSPMQKRAVRNLAGRGGLKIHVIEAFNTDFPELLAKSRMFLSGFGYSFYEALALGTYPITLPLSKAHGTDAEKFYNRMGIPSGIMESIEDVETIVNGMVQQENTFELLKIEDGTPNIVEEIASLLKNGRN